jgi:putative ABC transport system permease protein
MNHTYNRLYEMEIRMGNIINISTILAIFISCLGLFGLASYTIEKRTKEIGVRKVLGASVLKIAAMLSMEFLKWVALANIIAWPATWYMMDQWLSNFAYHITPGLWTFFIASLAGIFFAMVTILHQSIKAGLRNPVDALRYE